MLLTSGNTCTCDYPLQRINCIWAKKVGSQTDILGVGVDLNMLICVPQQTAASQSVVGVIVVVVFRVIDITAQVKSTSLCLGQSSS